MKRKVLAAVLVMAMAVATLAGCGNAATSTSSSTQASTETSASTEVSTPAEIPNVSLVVWGAEEDQTMLTQMIESFKTAYADKANFDITLGVQSESTAKDTVLADVEAAADVFSFADDQLAELVAAGALQEITLNADKVISDNGGAEAGSVLAATSNGKLYAYPMTADNGFFMFYNKEYFSEDDVKTMDKMMEVAANAGKKITMQYDSGWYNYAFFKGAGLSVGLNDDGVTNFCTYNSTDGKYKGVDVVQSMLDIAANPGFISLQDAAFVTAVQDGSVIAGVNGTWNAAVAQETWGDNYAACKLPTFTCAGDQVQMSSFAGYKLIGVNAYSENVGYAMMLGEWLTNYDNQVLRFEQRGLGPSNVEAAASDTVQSSPAIAALATQSAYATVQRVGGNFWTPTETMGAILANGNPDNIDLQKLLDDAVAGITAPVE